MIDDAGAVMGTTKISFIAPSVYPTMQTVLAKAPLQNGSPFRPDQSVRVRVVWSSEPALTAPLVAVTRINAQTFVYVVEKGDGGIAVARQRAVQLGPLVGNDYIVISGLAEGEQLVVAGVQKIGDGAPVQISAPSAPGGARQ